MKIQHTCNAIIMSDFKTGVIVSHTGLSSEQGSTENLVNDNKLVGVKGATQHLAVNHTDRERRSCSHASRSTAFRLRGWGWTIGFLVAANGAVGFLVLMAYFTIRLNMWAWS